MDPVDEKLYLTQDKNNGLLYRFTPDSYPDLSSGLLEAMIVSDNGDVSWGEIADPTGASTTEEQLSGAFITDGVRYLVSQWVVGLLRRKQPNSQC